MLALLLLVYALNFVDRQILSIVAEPVRKALQLNDSQMGLLGGLAFALLYSTLALPMARLADRTSRTRVIAGSLALWSGFTALCGLATGFWSLFLYRLGVGVGEAGGVAPSYALVADLYPPEKRARALAVYSLGIPLGAGGGAMLGGWIAQVHGWRMAFVVLGVAGLLLAPLFMMTVREPARPPSSPSPPGFLEVLRLLAGRPGFWLLALASGLASMVGYGLLFWFPAFLARSHGMTTGDIGLFFGWLLIIPGSIGLIAGGWLADRLGVRRARHYADVPALAFLVAAPLYAAAVLAPNPFAAFLLLVAPQALTLMWFGPVLAAVQAMVAPRARATASAIFLLINNLVGLGLGSTLIGFLSTAMATRYGEQSLRYAILAMLGFYLLSATLLLLAAPRLKHDLLGGTETPGDGGQ